MSVNQNAMAPRRVLLIAPQPFFQWRGSPIRVGFNLLALSESGYAVDLLTLPFGEDRQIPGVRVIRVGNIFGLRNIPIGPSPWKLFFDLRLLLRGLRLIRASSYDVVCAIEDAGPVGLILARLSGAGMIFEKHSDPGSYRRGCLRNLAMWLYGKVEAMVIRRADAVIGTGPGLVEQARRMAPHTPCHHVFDIPSSLTEAEPRRVKAVRERLAPAPDAVLAAYVGSFAVYQGVELLLAAVPMVVRAAPHVHFVIIGGTDAEIGARREALRAAGAEQAVSFLGKIPPDALPDYLAACDILVSARLAGANTPLKLLDYLKAGRAILATDNTANRQIIDEDCALFAAPDPESLAAGFLRLAADGALRARLAANGRALVNATYNFQEFKRRLRKVYDGVADARSASA